MWKQDHPLKTFENTTVWADCLNETENIIVEAKSSISRSHIRTAIGQIIEYSLLYKELNPDKEIIKAILLPEEPEETYKRILKQLNIMAYIENEDKEGFYSLHPK